MFEEPQYKEINCCPMEDCPAQAVGLVLESSSVIWCAEGHVLIQDGKRQLLVHYFQADKAQFDSKVKDQVVTMTKATAYVLKRFQKGKLSAEQTFNELVQMGYRGEHISKLMVIALLTMD